jgi:cysteinyl-tRNA synthetase
MYLYNSATHRKDEFVPNHPDIVKMYTCGPTVYHFAHIGNLRSYIMEDVLEKFLRYEGYHVKRVMNITDVGHLASDGDTGEDKMLKGAKRENKSVMDIAKFYTDAFFDDCDKLNIKRPDVVEPATACIGEYIRIISTLIEKGYGYVAGGNVYFDTSKLERYYIFNDHDAEDLAVGVREGVEEDVNKRNKNDFVLWFTQSKFEDQALKWDSPWGVGYPGWHIECSGISMKHLGEDLDIHCGGIDNAFPHHTNEIAQSEAYLGHKWCNYWMHVLHLNTNSGKMSKSKGEFLTVSLLEEKGYDPLAYRLFCLQSHYRKGLVFSWENLDNAQGAYRKLIARTAALKPGEGAVDEAVFAAQKEKFRKALSNDLNTSLGITALYDALKAEASDETKLALLGDFDQVLGLRLLEKAAQKREADAKAASNASSAGGIVITGEGDPEIDALVRQRAEAKKAKDFALADQLRTQLKEMGIEVTDTKDGAVWKRVS